MFTSATDSSLSRIGLGLAALGRPGYINLGHAEDLDGHSRDPEVLRAHAFTVLDDAYNSGIRYFDAARSYGQAEQFLASWIAERGITSGDLIVGSKWGYEYVADWQVDADVHEVKDHGLATLERQFDESVTLLGDDLNIYQIHSVTTTSPVLGDRAVLERLAEIRDAGTLVGFSTSGPDQATTIREAIALEVDGAPLFATVQSTWNLLEPSAGPALAEAADAGLTVIVKEALANGRLAGRDPVVADRLGDTLPGHSADAIALGAALAQPWASVVLSGAATTAHLASNLTALAINATDLEMIPDLAQGAEAYWAERSQLSWT